MGGAKIRAMWGLRGASLQVFGDWGCSTETLYRLSLLVIPK